MTIDANNVMRTKVRIHQLLSADVFWNDQVSGHRSRQLQIETHVM